MAVLRNRQFCAGLFFAGIFVEGLFPFHGLALFFLIPYAASLFFDFPERFNISLLVIFLFLMSLYYVFFIFFSGGSWFVLKNILYFYLMAVVFSFGDMRSSPQGYLRGFWWGLLPAALAAALFGLFKVFLQERGYVISGFIDLYNVLSTGYPVGSSLRSDYNLFSLSLLVALVGVMSFYFNLSGVARWCAVLCMGVLLLAIYYSGSRRAYLLLMVVVVWGGYVVMRSYGAAHLLKYIFLWVFLGFFVYVSRGLISVVDGDFSVYRRFPEWSSIFFSGEIDAALKVITFTPNRLLSNEASGAGLISSRLDRWEYALELLRVKGWLFGQGFSYHEAFSCQFVACEHSDYPHNVFLSELLIAGVFGGIFLVLVVFSLFSAAFGSSEELWLSGAAMVFVLAVPSILISGDGVFSISQVVASFFFLLIFSKEKYHLVFRSSGLKYEKTL